jgi:hypothetical protein
LGKTIGEEMNINEVESAITKKGILTIPAVKMHDDESYDYFSFNGEFDEYLEYLKKLNISYVYVQKVLVGEEEFYYLLDEDERIAVERDPLLEIEEEIGAVKLESLHRELENDKKYIGQLREIKIYAIIDGKELLTSIHQEWNKPLIGRIITAEFDMIDRIEVLSKLGTHKKRH